MPEFAYRSAFAGILLPGRHGAGDDDVGVEISEARRSLYSISPRAGRHAAVGEALGVELPPVGRFVEHDGGLLAWSGREQWTLAGPDAAPGPDPLVLGTALAGIAALVDHADGRAMLRVAGPAARRVLARLCAVDLHPRGFPPGRSAATRMGHIGALLLALDDAPTFEVHVFRSFAASFYHELTAAAAGFGYRVKAP